MCANHNDDTKRMIPSVTNDRRYDPANNLEVLFRINSSVWPRVLPFCIANAAIAYALFYTDTALELAFRLPVKDKGHTFLSMILSYLVVTRNKTCLKRYMQARKGLSDINRNGKEIVHHAVAFTRYKEKDNRPQARRWRMEVTKCTMCILRLITTFLQAPTKNKLYALDTTDMSDEEQKIIKQYIQQDEVENADKIGLRKEDSPRIMLLMLRTIIANQVHIFVKEDEDGNKKPQFDVNEEIALLKISSGIMTAYDYILDDVTTPIPFPLMQMTRTLIFIYLITLPFAMADDFDVLWAYILVVFVLTYGFLGLELISIEMDDPFGNDQTDFNVKQLAENACVDMISILKDIDQEAEKELQKYMERNITSLVAEILQKHMGKSPEQYEETKQKVSLCSPPKRKIFRDLPHEEAFLPDPDRNIKMSLSGAEMSLSGATRESIYFDADEYLGSGETDDFGRSGENDDDLSYDGSDGDSASV